MGDFTVIQSIYADGYEYLTKEDVKPSLIQEFDVSLEEVHKKSPKAVEAWFEVLTDETFVNGQIMKHEFAHLVISVLEDEVLYPGFKAYVRNHEEFKDPVRNIEVRVNNVECFPSAVEKRRLEAKQLGEYLGKKLGIGRPIK